MEITIDWNQVEINITSEVICISGLFPYNLMFPGNDNNDIQDFLYDNFGIEVRFCEECGKPYNAGFITNDGDWYCCQECFTDAMDKQYGKGKWKASDEEGVYGGWYEHLNDEGAWEDTGTFYTEWN